MPTHDFDNIGDVLDFNIIKGTIVTVDSSDDTCTVRLVGESAAKTALLFYHCEPDSILRDNGAIKDAAKGFKADDEVIVMQKHDGSVVKVIGHIGGAKHCKKPYLSISLSIPDPADLANYITYLIVWDIDNNKLCDEIFTNDDPPVLIVFPCRVTTAISSVVTTWLTSKGATDTILYQTAYRYPDEYYPYILNPLPSDPVNYTYPFRPGLPIVIGGVMENTLNGSLVTSTFSYVGKPENTPFLTAVSSVTETGTDTEKEYKRHIECETNDSPGFYFWAQDIKMFSKGIFSVCHAYYKVSDLTILYTRPDIDHPWTEVSRTYVESYKTATRVNLGYYKDGILGGGTTYSLMEMPEAPTALTDAIKSIFTLFYGFKNPPNKLFYAYANLYGA